MSLTDEQIAAQIMSDCGCSTNNQRLLERVTERIAAHVKRELALKWTDALPTVAGQYWWRLPEYPACIEMIEVYEEEYGLFWRAGDYVGSEPVYERGGQWAGPMPEPTE